VAIAHQTEVLGAANTTAGNYDTAVTPAAAPDGVCVILVQGGAVTDLVTSVAYGVAGGAVTLTRRRFDTEATEAGGVYIYWGTGLPTGTQTVRVARTGTTNLRAVIWTMTVAAGQSVLIDADNVGTSASVANPGWTLNTTPATNTVCYEGIHSGLQTMTATPAAGWTLSTSDDIGTTGRGWARRTATGGAVASGWVASTAEDFVGSSVAFKEALVAVVVDPVHAAQGGRQVNPGRESAIILNP
jgi:hypothetical protein